MRIVIMGGTSGIGAATARRLTADGAEVIVTGRDRGRLDAIRAEVAAAERLDATSEEDVAAFFDRIGEFDHLVLAFSGGAIGLGSLADAKSADVRAAFEGKVLSFLTAIRHARVTGSITLISAASARGARPGTVVLAAVNGAVERMVSPLAAELAPVRVNAVSPGAIDTPWWSFVPEETRQAQFAAFAESVPAGRVGRPEDIAEAIAYLVRAEYVTGTVLPVDGGLTVA